MGLHSDDFFLQSRHLLSRLRTVLSSGHWHISCPRQYKVNLVCTWALETNIFSHWATKNQYCITPLAWVEIQCFALTAYMLTCLHAYMRTRLHACAYMFARLYALICLDTTVFLHAYVLTCLLATPCSPTLTHIDNHLTPCDTYLITISGRTSSTGVRHTFRFLVL